MTARHGRLRAIAAALCFGAAALSAVPAGAVSLLLESNGYRAPLEKLAAVRLPAIVLVNVRGYSHFVVLEGIRDSWVLLSDPANGTRSESVSEFEDQWTGIFFLILTNADQAQERFNDNTRWAAAPAPPWELLRYTLDLATLARPAMLGLGRF